MLSARKALTETLTANLNTVAIDELRMPLWDAFSEFSNATLTRIVNHRWEALSAITFCQNVGGWTETNTNDFLTLAQEVGFTTDSRRLHDIDRDLKSYQDHIYSGLCPLDNESDYPEERRSQITSLYLILGHKLKTVDFGAIRAYDNIGGNEIHYISDPELRKLILCPDDGFSREEIADVIINHDTFSVERIKLLIKFDTKSLQSGVL